MPFISVHTNATLSAEKKELIKSELGRLLPIIPGKAESGLMVEFQDGLTMYKAGTGDETCAMIEVRCFKQADMEDNKKFVAETLAMFEKELPVATNRLSLNFTEMMVWGGNGKLNM